MEASGTGFMLPPEMRARCSGLTQHSVIADDRNAAGQWWFDAALTNPALERLESSQCRQSARRIGFSLDEMNEAIVIEPERKVANARWPRGFQFLEYFGDQLRVSVGQLRLGLIP